MICDKHQNFDYRRLKHSNFWLTVVVEVFVCSAEASALPPSGPSEFWDTWTCGFLESKRTTEGGIWEHMQNGIGNKGISIFKSGAREKCSRLFRTVVMDVFDFSTPARRMPSQEVSLLPLTSSEVVLSPMVHSSQSKAAIELLWFASRAWPRARLPSSPIRLSFTLTC